MGWSRTEIVFAVFFVLVILTLIMVCGINIYYYWKNNGDGQSSIQQISFTLYVVNILGLVFSLILLFWFMYICFRADDATVFSSARSLVDKIKIKLKQINDQRKIKNWASSLPKEQKKIIDQALTSNYNTAIGQLDTVDLSNNSFSISENAMNRLVASLNSEVDHLNTIAESEDIVLTNVNTATGVAIPNMSPLIVPELNREIVEVNVEEARAQGIIAEIAALRNAEDIIHENEIENQLLNVPVAQYPIAPMNQPVVVQYQGILPRDQVEIAMLEVSRLIKDRQDLVNGNDPYKIDKIDILDKEYGEKMAFIQRYKK